MSKLIFLDLEGTIFESVDNPKLLLNQINWIKQFINPSDKIVLFSFALWEENDLTDLISEIVENEFGSFTTVFKNELKPLFKKKFGITNDLDFIDFTKDKETVFTLFILEEIMQNRIKEDVLFFDDLIQTVSMVVNGIKV